MSANPNLAELVSLLGDSSRAAILTSLMDGRFHTASELALAAGVTPQTASFHLGKMASGMLVAAEKHGRHRYYKLANEEIARALETLLSISRPAEIRSLRQSEQMKALCKARTCYDHLAGKLGVGLTRAMLEQGWIEEGDGEYVVTTVERAFFCRLGVGSACAAQGAAVVRPNLPGLERAAASSGGKPGPSDRCPFVRHELDRTGGFRPGGRRNRTGQGGNQEIFPPGMEMIFKVIL